MKLKILIYAMVKFLFIFIASDFFNYMKKCDKISKIMHDNFYKEREFALEVIEKPESVKMEDTHPKIKNDFSHKINVKFFIFKKLLIIAFC